MIWLNFLLGSNFLFFSFKLIIIFCHTETLRIKMNRNVYFLSSAFRFYYTRVKLHAQNLRATRVEFPRISRAWRACRCCSTRERYSKSFLFSSVATSSWGGWQICYHPPSKPDCQAAPGAQQAGWRDERPAGGVQETQAEPSEGSTHTGEQAVDGDERPSQESWQGIWSTGTG